MSFFSRISNWVGKLTGLVGGSAQPASPAVEPELPELPPPPPYVDPAGVLQIAGSRRADVIVLSVDPTVGKVNVVVNEVATQVDLAGVVAVSINSGGGRDEVRVTESAPGEFTLPILLTGGGNTRRPGRAYASAA
jgi:hypothetical protein